MKNNLGSMLVALAVASVCQNAASAQAVGNPQVPANSAPAAQAPGTNRVQVVSPRPADIPNLQHMYSGPLRVFVTDESPQVRDLRHLPPVGSYMVEFGAPPASAQQQSVQVVRPTSNPGVMNELQPANFGSNISPSHAVANNLPSGALANHVPTQTPQQAKRATKDVSGRINSQTGQHLASSNPLGGAPLSYAPSSSVSGGSASRVATNVSGELSQRGHLLAGHE